MAKAVRGAVAVKVWNWMCFIPHEGQDYKDSAADEWSMLLGLWDEFVSKDHELPLEDGYNCPRAFLADEHRQKVWETVQYRFFRYLAGLSNSEFSEFVRSTYRQYTHKVKISDEYWEEQLALSSADSDDFEDEED